MEFTYEAYKNMILNLKNNKYKIVGYNNDFEGKTVILRHDVDFSLEKALDIAKLENQLEVFSTFFILLSTDFYNINSIKSLEILKNIIRLGGKIGLHFDEKKYLIDEKNDYIKYISYELEIISTILEFPIDIVSMHRPSQNFLEMNLEIPNVTNSYQKKFFTEFKYVSDSRMHWRENIEEIISSKKYQNLHILTHPFWYNFNKEEREYKIKKFLQKSVFERYNALNENIKDFEQIFSKEVLNDYE
ncbi:hypothetical protein LDK18_08475 [Fusobacterium nucleatum subsp. nucleatum ATCC 23726]|nr:hypothetical protein [Fusobacterium nucleatum]AVQ22383.1 hypothetical protein C4N14_00985 [Fusobacterium nucleatum subsp. nucleatum ATCC 23726]